MVSIEPENSEAALRRRNVDGDWKSRGVRDGYVDPAIASGLFQSSRIELCCTVMHVDCYQISGLRLRSKAERKVATGKYQ